MKITILFLSLFCFGAFAQSPISGIEVKCKTGQGFSYYQNKCVTESKVCTAMPCPAGKIKDIDCSCRSEKVPEPASCIPGTPHCGSFPGQPSKEDFKCMKEHKCVVGKTSGWDGKKCVCTTDTPTHTIMEFEGCTRSNDRQSISCPDGVYKKTPSTIEDDGKEWDTSIENQGNPKPTNSNTKQ